MTRLLTVADMAVREMVRRRVVLILLLLLPLAFYLIRHNDHTGQSVRSLFMGLAWAVSTAALFAAATSRVIEPRLRLSGYRSHHLYLGRMIALWAVGLALAVPLFILVAVDQHHVRLGGIAVAMLFCVTVGAPLGLLLAAVVPRELEGTLLLLVVVGLEMIVDPASTAARLMPLWSSREIGTYAVDHTDTGYLVQGTIHGLVVTAGLALLVAITSTTRLHTRSRVRLASTR